MLTQIVPAQSLQPPKKPIILKSSGRWMDKAVVTVIVEVDNPQILNEILTRVLIKRF